MQIKLYECEVRLQNTGMVKLLNRSVSKPASNPIVKDMSQSTTLPSLGGDDDEDDAGSLVNSEDDEYVETPPAPVVVVPEAPKKPMAPTKKPMIKYFINPPVVRVDLMFGLIVPDKFHHAHF